MKLKDISLCGNCLSDLIGFDSCETPTQCVTITQLGGISEEFLDSISDPSNQETSYDVIDKAKKNAYLALRQDLLSQFGKVGSFGYELLKSEDLSLIKPKSIFTKTKPYIGQIIYFDNSKFQALNINSVDLYSDAVGDITIKVFDVNSGQVLHQQISPIVVGYNSIEVNSYFELQSNNEQILIQVEPSASLNGKLYKSNCGASNVGCGCLCSSIQSTNTEFAQYDSIMDIVNNSYSYTDTFFCVDYTIECDIDNLMCKYSKLFDYAFLLKTYIEIINLQITSPRINFLAETNLEAIQKVILPEKVKQYYQALNRVAKQVATSSTVEDSACFSCIVETDVSIRFVDRN